MSSPEERTAASYGPNVKIVCKLAAPPSCDLVVRVRDVQSPTGWRDVATFNDMSDGLAYHNADSRARMERMRLMEGEQT